MSRRTPATSAVAPTMQRAGGAEQPREAAAEQAAGDAAMVRAQRDQQAGDRQHEAGPERAQLDERAAEEHERADDRQCDRRGIRGAADDVPQALLDLLADDAALPADQEQRGQEEPERSQPEADQLGMLVSPPLVPLVLARSSRALLHAGRRAWPQGSLLLPRRHAERRSTGRSVSLPACESPTVPRAARIAVTVVFFASGGAYGSWVARVPSLQEELDASTSELGLALFGVAAGAVVALPVGGWLVARLGSRLVTRVSLVGVAIALPLIGLAPSLVLLGAAFAVFGAAGAMLDLAMNAHGVAVEERYARPILSGFHASFSFGGLVGAVAGGLAAAAGISPLAQFTAAGLVILGIAVWSRGPLLSREVDIVPGPVYGRPSGALVTLAVIAFACLLAEGATGDWSGVYMNDVLGTGEGAATAAFVAFSLTMTLGRMVGDRLTAAWGAVALTRRAGVLGSVGLGVSLFFDNPIVAVIGFACLGAGLATVVPIVFRAAGQRTPAPGAGIAAVSTVGYTAFLVGPPAIGFLAEAIGLRASLGVVAGLAALIAVLAGATRPPPTAA